MKRSLPERFLTLVAWMAILLIVIVSGPLWY